MEEPPQLRTQEEVTLGVKESWPRQEKKKKVFLRSRLHQAAEMRPNFSTSWIVRGWITCVLVGFYAQVKTHTPGAEKRVERFY